jgi:hypothetical protein
VAVNQCNAKGVVWCVPVRAEKENVFHRKPGGPALAGLMLTPGLYYS